MWTVVAPQLGIQKIQCVAVYNNKIYGGTSGTGPGGELYEWNGVDAWVMVAPMHTVPPGISDFTINSLAVYGQLYGGTDLGKLLWWDQAGGAWVEKAGPYSGYHPILAMVVYHGQLYGADDQGNLLVWNGVNAWTLAAPLLGSSYNISSLAVFNDKIYGASSSSGSLLEWDGISSWVEVAPILAGAWVNSIKVFNGKIYGGTANGHLYEWNGVNAWVDIATLLLSNQLVCLSVLNGELYGVTHSGDLYKLVGATLLPAADALSFSEMSSQSLAILGSNLYAGEGVNFGTGRLQLFTPPTAPVVTTSPAGITPVVIILNGILNDGGVTCYANFNYGLTTGLGTLTPVQRRHTGGFSVNLLVASLPGNTTYYYRAQAINSTGVSYGSILPFVTPGVPQVTTLPATGVT
jgi:hypothetical protein